MAIVRSVRGEAMTREKISMPLSSVPMRWPKLGGLSWSPGIAVRGSKGAMAGPITASVSATPTMAAPTRADGWVLIR